MKEVLAQAHDIGDLYGLLGGDAPAAVVVREASVPEPQRRLLAHESHMTVTLEAHHGGAVEVVVLDRYARDGRYARKILLRCARSGDGAGAPERSDAVVMFGIVLIDFRFTTEAARREILSEETPVGHVLIRHNRLRRISTHCLLEIEPDDEIRRHFSLGDPVDCKGSPVHGRLATIFCDERPAVELLEVVPPGRAAAAVRPARSGRR